MVNLLSRRYPQLWMDYLKPYVDEFITDTYGTAVAVINPKAKYKVVIEGHADEISWYVNYISEKVVQNMLRKFFCLSIKSEIIHAK